MKKLTEGIKQYETKNHGAVACNSFMLGDEFKIETTNAIMESMNNFKSKFIECKNQSHKKYTNSLCKVLNKHSGIITEVSWIRICCD